MIENISNTEIYIGLAISGLFTGIGVTLGTYIANKHLIDSLSKLKNFWKNGRNNSNKKT